MGGGVFGTEGKEDAIKATQRTYLNVVVTRKDWCSYEGECLINDVVFHKHNLCVMCEHRKIFDVPKMLKEERDRQVCNMEIKKEC